MSAINILSVIFLILLGLPTLYIFIFSLAGLFYRNPGYPETAAFKKIAVLIPGYREDEVILEVARQALNQDYPSDFFDIVVIADSFLPETLRSLREMPVTVIEVSFEKSTKSKALNRAMEVLGKDYDLAVVLDADNLMETGFLSGINRIFEKNIAAVQGHRTAKNMDTSMAVLDAASEEINNHIFRKGHRALGLSSAIIGSGMAFRYGFFKEMMRSVEAIGGFDKEIELKMLRAGHKIEYLDDLLVYDEKVQKAEVFSNQRRRWLSAQLHYFRKDILKSINDLFIKGNVDYFDKAIQFIQPPRVLLLGAVLLAGIVFIPASILVEKNLLFSILWAALITACLLSFVFSVPWSFYNRRTLIALADLPKGMVLMIGSLLKIRGANRQFIHTKHSGTGTSIKKDL